MSANKFVVITGSGAGLGKCIAFEFAAKGYSLALVSLHQNELDEVGKEIKEQFPSVQYKALAVDMLQPDAPNKIKVWVEDEAIQVVGLVNNVGFGYAKEFEQLEEGFIRNLLQLNVNTTTLLTHALSPKLIANSPSFILNVASMAAYFPLPYKAIYSASKGFVLTFSQALREEYKDKKSECKLHYPRPYDNQ